MIAYMIGDNHGHFDHIIEIVRQDRPDAIIFLGDLECQRPFHEEVAAIRDLTEIYWIPGNHDTDSAETYRNLFESELSDRNLHGRVVDIGGIRVAGLGSVFRGEVWYPPDVDVRFENYKKYIDWLENLQPLRLRNSTISTGKARKHRSTIFHEDFIRLYGQQADILVSHEAPSCHPHGFREIDALAQSLHVKFAFHGHHHDSINYREFDAKLGFQAFGVGFCGITDMYGAMILPGDFDEGRTYRQRYGDQK